MSNYFDYLLLLLDCIARTTYIAAVCCYRPSRMVCWSVCHSNQPYKDDQTDRDAVWIEDLGGPENDVLGGGPDPPGKGHF